MSDTPATPSRHQALIGMLWGVFAVLAAIGAFENHTVRVISWSLALAVAITLAVLSRRSTTAPPSATMTTNN